MKRWAISGVLILVSFSIAHAADALSLTEPSAPVQHSTGAWATYSNARYGFEFQYPDDLTVVENLKLKTRTTFSKIINSALYAVGLFKKGQFIGLAVAVVPKAQLQYRSKAVPGFYKYDAALNTWLGYNPVAAEYTVQHKHYFYLGEDLCNHAEELGPGKIWTYSTGRLTEKVEPRNDIILTNQAYAFEIPRDNPDKNGRPDTSWAVIQDKIRDSFTLKDLSQAFQVDCSTKTLSQGLTSLPILVSPSTGTTIDPKKAVSVVLSTALPQGIGVVFYLTGEGVSGADKLAYEEATGDMPSGDHFTLKLPYLDQTLLHACFYKKASGRKILLGDEACLFLSLSQPKEID